MASRILTTVLAVVVCLATARAEGAVKRVSMRGTDSSLCGAAAARCRTIGQAIANAHPGDTVLVEPGIYGDVDNDGDFTDPGEEVAGDGTGCSCVVDVSKAIIVLSTGGAPATTIAAGGTNNSAVKISASGAVFGAKNQGFTLTGAGTAGLPWTLLIGNGISASARGNIAYGSSGFGAFGSDGSVLEDNRATGNETGYGFWVNCNCSVVENISENQIVAFYTTARAPRFVGNVASASQTGFDVLGVNGAVLYSNTAVGNEMGFAIYSTTGPVISATYNAAIGNTTSAFYVGTTSLTLKYNNIYGTLDNIGLQNSSGGAVVATNNYWGAPTGPGLDPADDVANAGGSTTTTTPFRLTPVLIPLTAK